MPPLHDLGTDAWLTLAVLLLVLVGLVRDWLGPDVLMTGAVAVLMVAGVVTPSEALAGFANAGVLTVAGLFVVARAVEQSGALDRLTRWALGNSTREATGYKRTKLRMMVATAGLSSVLNNTAVVAMLAPAVRRWALRRGMSPKRLLIPVSYAAIVGGMCTVIGTSTNLVVAGLMDEAGLGAFGMFELAQIGLPITVAGIAFMITLGSRVLPGDLEVGASVAAPVAEAVAPAEPSRTMQRPASVLLVIGLMIAVPVCTEVPLIVSVFVAATVLVFGRSISPRDARASLDLTVIVTIAMAFGLGAAMTKSGLAAFMGNLVLAPAASLGPLAVVAAIFLTTALCTELVTNNAAAVLMFPIVTAVAADLDMDPRRALIVVAVAASCSFLTPIGYQTNMMVARLGGYRFLDFTRAGVGMTAMALLVTLLVAGLIW
jgi:anion transporter